MHWPLRVRLEKHFGTFQDLDFYDGEELSTIFNNFLRKIKAVMTHFKGNENAACYLKAILVNQATVLLDYLENFAETENWGKAFKWIRVVWVTGDSSNKWPYVCRINICIWFLLDHWWGVFLVRMLQAPNCEFSYCIWTHLTQCVVVARLGTFDQCIQQVLDLSMFVDLVSWEPSDKLEAKRFE